MSSIIRPTVAISAASTRTASHPRARSRWYTGSGISREVHLLTGPAVNIEPTWPRVTTGGDVVTVRTKVTNTTDADTTAEVAGVVTGPQGDEHPLAAQTVDIPRCGEAIVDHELRIDGAQHWSPAHPHLHEARVVVGSADTGHGEADKTDEATARFGIRDLSVTVDGLSIDGEDHMLRGAYIHHDNGMLGAATFRDAETRRVRILKEAGFNAIRSAHNPASRALLDGCRGRAEVEQDRRRQGPGAGPHPAGHQLHQRSSEPGG